MINTTTISWWSSFIHL